MNCQKHLFSLDPQVHYLNCAYMSPLLRSVEQIGIEALRKKSDPYLIKPQDFFTESNLLREEFAGLIGASNPQRIAIIPSVSYGMAVVAKNLITKPNQKIIVANEQFPSNIYAWQELSKEKNLEVQIVNPPESLQNRGKIWNEKILESIDNQTVMVALGNVHWADGTKFDLQKIRERCTEVGAKLVIDGTQSVGALPFDVEKIKPDALICGGYKFLMSPYSIGLAYFGEYFDGGKPIEQNWIARRNSENFANLVNYEPEYQNYSLRYDMGERSNFILVPMFIEAIRQIRKWEVTEVQKYCQNLTKNLVPALREKGFWIEDEAWRGSHLFGIRLPEGLKMEKIQEVLAKNNIFVSIRGSAIRISPNVYNEARDIEKLSEVLVKNA